MKKFLASFLLAVTFVGGLHADGEEREGWWSWAKRHTRGFTSYFEKKQTGDIADKIPFDLKSKEEYERESNFNAALQGYRLYKREFYGYWDYFNDAWDKMSSEDRKRAFEIMEVELKGMQHCAEDVERYDPRENVEYRKNTRSAVMEDLSSHFLTKSSGDTKALQDKLNFLKKIEDFLDIEDFLFKTETNKEGLNLLRNNINQELKQQKRLELEQQLERQQRTDSLKPSVSDPFAEDVGRVIDRKAVAEEREDGSNQPLKTQGWRQKIEDLKSFIASSFQNIAQKLNEYGKNYSQEEKESQDESQIGHRYTKYADDQRVKNAWEKMKPKQGLDLKSMGQAQRFRKQRVNE